MLLKHLSCGTNGNYYLHGYYPQMHAAMASAKQGFVCVCVHTRSHTHTHKHHTHNTHHTHTTIIQRNVQDVEHEPLQAVSHDTRGQASTKKTCTYIYSYSYIHIHLYIHLHIHIHIHIHNYIYRPMTPSCLATH